MRTASTGATRPCIAAAATSPTCLCRWFRDVGTAVQLKPGTQKPRASRHAGHRAGIQSDKTKFVPTRSLETNNPTQNRVYKMQYIGGRIPSTRGIFMGIINSATLWYAGFFGAATAMTYGNPVTHLIEKFLRFPCNLVFYTPKSQSVTELL